MRSLGLTLICLYQMLRGLTGLVFGLFIVCYTGPSNQFVARASQGNAAERLMASFGHAAGLAIVVFAVVHLLAGYGVLRRQNWGRILTLLLSAVELVLILPSAIHANRFSLVFSPLNAACILYLSMPPVRRAFQAASDAVRISA
ncbi:MAG: hypothetical protein WAK02_06705 [Terriglobales bacterium]|jgi:uncharacterized membrane protein